jgi:hypothetical protein
VYGTEFLLIKSKHPIPEKNNIVFSVTSVDLGLAHSPWSVQGQTVEFGDSSGQITVSIPSSAGIKLPNQSNQPCPYLVCFTTNVTFTIQFTITDAISGKGKSTTLTFPLPVYGIED